METSSILVKTVCDVVLVCVGVGGCAVIQLANGRVPATPSGYMPQDRAPIVCDRGYKLADGDLTPYMVCRQDGTWKHVGGYSRCTSECSLQAHWHLLR